MTRFNLGDKSESNYRERAERQAVIEEVRRRRLLGHIQGGPST